MKNQKAIKSQHHANSVPPTCIGRILVVRGEGILEARKSRKTCNGEEGEHVSHHIHLRGHTDCVPCPFGEFVPRGASEPLFLIGGELVVPRARSVNTMPSQSAVRGLDEIPVFIRIFQAGVLGMTFTRPVNSCLSCTQLSWKCQVWHRAESFFPRLLCRMLLATQTSQMERKS